MRVVLNLSRCQLHELNLAIAVGFQSTINAAKDEHQENLAQAVHEWNRAYVSAMKKGK